MRCGARPDHSALGKARDVRARHDEVVDILISANANAASLDAQ
jgi:hypothetical protein